MSPKRSIQTSVSILLLILLSAAALQAVTVDPILSGLARRGPVAQGARPGLDLSFAGVIALEPGPSASQTRIGVILHLEDLEGNLPDLSDVPGLKIGSVHGEIATARLPLSSLADLVARDGIRHIAAARLLRPALDMAVPAGNVDQAWNGTPAYTGAGVIVGVIDSGIDWQHDDFDNPDGTTRIKAIWDLFGTGTPPAGFAYGAEYTPAQINAGTVAEQDFSGHGSHVTGMAAGNGRASGGQYKGVAFEADIIFAKAYDDNQGGFPEDKTIDAMNYLVQKAQALGQPLAVNMSLGGHLGAHDGTGAQEQVVDNLSGTGVVFCIAAGNEGEDSLHDSGPAANTDLVFRIVTYTPNPGVENDVVVIAIWVDGATSPSVTVMVGATSFGPVASGTQEGGGTADGVIVVDNASAGVDPSNGDKQILIQLDDREGTAPTAADWTIHIEGGSGTAHAWKLISTMTTGFPNSDQKYSVAMPACAEQAVTLAATKTRNSWPAIGGTVSYTAGTSWGDAAVGDRAPFSGIGPTRDGRQKPDLAAPGMAIISVRSRDTTPTPPNELLASGGDYYITQGTSMATPFTCGVAALLLEKDGQLTAAEVRSALRSSAVSDGFTGTTWNEEFGAGKVDAVGALAAIGGGANPDGDIDADGAPSILDIVILVNHILDPVGNPLDTDQRERADVYPPPGGDDLLNASDLARIVAFILGTDTPGLRMSPSTPVTLAVGAPYLADDGWWVPVRLQGEGMAAGQLALNLESGGWRSQEARIEASEPVELATQVAGSQLRLLFYDLDNRLPADGITVHLPCRSPEGPGAPDAPDAPELAGLLVVDGTGAAREVSLESYPSQRAGYLDVFPNPAPGAAEIRFGLPRAGAYSLAVYDLRGRRVRLLRQGAGSQPEGILDWHGKDAAGRPLPSGVYLVRLISGDQVISRKVLLSR